MILYDDMGSECGGFGVVDMFVGIVVVFVLDYLVMDVVGWWVLLDGLVMFVIN